MPPPADAVVDADPRQPRGRSLHPRDRLPGSPRLEQRLLDRILGLALIAKNRQRERVEPPGVRDRNGLEGRARATPRPPDAALAVAITPFPTRAEAVLLTRRTYTGPQAHAPSPGSFSPHPCPCPGRRDRRGCPRPGVPRPRRGSQGAVADRGHGRPRPRRRALRGAPEHPIRPRGDRASTVSLEKNVDLDVGRRLAALLRADLVDVVMTRSTDAYVSAARREQVVDRPPRGARGERPRRCLVQSAGRSGSLVLYPTGASAVFAQTVSDALSRSDHR